MEWSLLTLTVSPLAEADRLLKNYLRCCCGFKNELRMLIYKA